ncbi:hypothetical protein PMIN06_011962 [Paraphaeosphaeria minitans]
MRPSGILIASLVTTILVPALAFPSFGSNTKQPALYKSEPFIGSGEHNDSHKRDVSTKFDPSANDKRHKKNEARSPIRLSRSKDSRRSEKEDNEARAIRIQTNKRAIRNQASKRAAEAGPSITWSYQANPASDFDRRSDGHPLGINTLAHNKRQHSQSYTVSQGKRSAKRLSEPRTVGSAERRSSEPPTTSPWCRHWNIPEDLNYRPRSAKRLSEPLGTSPWCRDWAIPEDLVY